MNNLVESIDQTSQTDVIYTDFNKVFDSVPHHLLIHKLKSYNCSNKLQTLIANYLSNRKLKITLKNEESYMFTTKSGVPQGSILGPLLFLLYINDITCNINCKALLFADDLKLYKEINSLNDALNLQDNLNKLANWCYNWKLSLNMEKCFSMTISRKNQINNIDFIYNLNGSSLKKVNQINDLGVIFQSNLKFTTHICDIKKKGP